MPPFPRDSRLGQIVLRLAGSFLSVAPPSGSLLGFTFGYPRTRVPLKDLCNRNSSTVYEGPLLSLVAPRLKAR